MRKEGQSEKRGKTPRRGFRLKKKKKNLSQVNISSGQEERVSERKELREGAGSLPHSPASVPAVVV